MLDVMTVIEFMKWLETNSDYELAHKLNQQATIRQQSTEREVKEAVRRFNSRPGYVR